jgi:recombination protein RecA
MGERFDRLLASKLVADMRKSHGESIIVAARDYSIQRVPRIKTGIFMLDYALGGGFPAGRTNIIWGNKSTGKSDICVRALANAQRLCSNCYKTLPAFSSLLVPDPDGVLDTCSCDDQREHVCAYLDVEGTIDQEWARNHGVDTDTMLLSVPEYAEQTLDIAEGLLLSGEVDFLVIDSIAFMTPAKEIEESTAKALQAEQARVLGRGIRKFGAALNKLGNQTGRRPTLLFTNQVRMKVGLLFGNPETQPGGNAPGFSATTETKTYGGKYEMDDATGRPIHVDLQFRVEKNKSAGAHIEGEWRLMLSDGELKKKGEVYEEPLLVEKGLALGLIEKVNNNNWTCLGETHRSKSAIVKLLATDRAVKQVYTKALMNVLLGS